ncbi:hypothetical protein D3C81_1739320 [compost metagenome]
MSKRFRLRFTVWLTDPVLNHWRAPMVAVFTSSSRRKVRGTRVKLPLSWVACTPCRRKS